MSGYLLGVVGVVVLAATLTSVLPEGKTSSTIRAIARLACILAIISPVLHFFQSGKLSFENEKKQEGIFADSVIEAEGRFIEYYSEMRIREAEEKLKLELSERYALDTLVTLEYTCQTEAVGVFYTDRKIRIVRMRVKLLQEAKEEVVKSMWEYLTKNYCSEVLIE